MPLSCQIFFNPGAGVTNMCSSCEPCTGLQEQFSLLPRCSGGLESRQVKCLKTECLACGWSVKISSLLMLCTCLYLCIVTRLKDARTKLQQ